jgi:hypothetical protein
MLLFFYLLLMGLHNPWQCSVSTAYSPMRKMFQTLPREQEVLSSAPHVSLRARNQLMEAVRSRHPPSKVALPIPPFTMPCVNQAHSEHIQNVKRSLLMKLTRKRNSGWMYWYLSSED